MPSHRHLDALTYIVIVILEGAADLQDEAFRSYLAQDARLQYRLGRVALIIATFSLNRGRAFFSIFPFRIFFILLKSM